VANVLGSPLTIDMADTPQLRAALSSVPGVAAIAPRIDFGAQFSTPDRRPPPEDGSELPEADRGQATFLMVTAFDPALEPAVTPKRWEWVAAGRGRMPATADSTELVLNDDFARSIAVALQPMGAALPPVERQAALITADRDSSLNGENVVVGGGFVSVTPNDRRVGFIALATAQRLLRMEGRVTEYGIAVQKGFTPETVRDALAAKLGPEYEVHTWEERLPFVRELVATQDKIFEIVSTVFLLVVLLGIVNAMLMSVLERVREIGTMLAVGMRRWQIAQLFLMEGLVLGLVGGLIGVAVGLAWVGYTHQAGILMPAPGAKFPSVLHPAVTATFVARALVQATVGAALASLLPAYRASQLRPVEALSHT
jgi:putative ABC transport system permease protein